MPIIISPTEAMLTRIVDRSGGGGGGGNVFAAGGRGGGDTRVGSSGGTVAQAANCNVSSNKNNFLKLVTEPDTHDVDFCCPEPTPSHVQFVKVVDGADINPKVISIIDLRTLHT